MATDPPATARQLDTVNRSVVALTARVDRIVQALNDRLTSIKQAEDQLKHTEDRLRRAEERLRELERLDVARLEQMMRVDTTKLLHLDTAALGRLVANEAHEIARVAQIDQRLTALQTVVTRLAHSARP